MSRTARTVPTPADRDITLRKIEAGWDGPMANTRKTRIRFAMWDALRLAATVVRNQADRVAVLRLLSDDVDLFERGGLETKR